TAGQWPGPRTAPRRPRCQHDRRRDPRRRPRPPRRRDERGDRCDRHPALHVTAGTTVYVVMTQNPEWADHASFTTYREAHTEPIEVLHKMVIGTASWKMEKPVLAHVSVRPAEPVPHPWRRPAVCGSPV